MISSHWVAATKTSKLPLLAFSRPWTYFVGVFVRAKSPDLKIVDWSKKHSSSLQNCRIEGFSMGVSDPSDLCGLIPIENPLKDFLFTTVVSGDEFEP